MAAFTKPANGQGSPSLTTINPPNNCKISGLLVGEDVGLGDACFIGVNGSGQTRIFRSIGTAVNAAAKVDGFAMTKGLLAQNDAVTLVHDIEVGWENSVTPGTRLFLSGSVAGGLDTVPSTGGTGIIGTVIDNTTNAGRVYLNRSSY